MELWNKIRYDKKKRTYAVLIAIGIAALVIFSAVSCSSRAEMQASEEAEKAAAEQTEGESLLAKGSDEAKRANNYNKAETALLQDLSSALWASKDGSSVWSFSAPRNAISIVEDGTTVTQPFVIYGLTDKQGSKTAVVKIGESFDIVVLNAPQGSSGAGGDYLMINSVGDEPHYRTSKTGELEVRGTPDWLTSVGVDVATLERDLKEYTLKAHPAATIAQFAGEAKVTHSDKETKVLLEYELNDGSKKAIKATVTNGAAAPVITG